MIKTCGQLMEEKGKSFVFKKVFISESMIKTFGNITGDWNDHNEKATSQFKKPTAQGFLSLSLFGGLHKQVCQIPGSDPMNTGARNVHFLKPIFASEELTAQLRIKDFRDAPKYTEVQWEYELWQKDETRLFSSEVILRYTKT